MTGVVREVLVRWLGAPIWLRALAPFVVMGALWISSSITPAPSEPDIVRSLLHNGAHVVAYALLAGSWLLLHSLQGLSVPAIRPRTAALRAVLLATVYGAVDEWHQHFVPGRVCSVSDLMTDACGATLAVAALLALLREAEMRRWRWWMIAAGAASLASVAAATWLPW